MYQRRLDRMIVDLDLMLARRRADACTPGSPSWDAAMGLVEELEDELRQVEPRADESRDLLALAASSN
jgi:hypothetical protein